MTRSSLALHRTRAFSAACLVAVVAASSLPLPSVAVAVPDAAPAVGVTLDAKPLDDAERAAIDEPVGDRPSIMYEDAMAHEGDVIEFEPGGRVERGFEPRADDAWPIDGEAPRSLPPGRASGREMAKSPTGSRWARLDADSPAAPGGDSGAAIAGDEEALQPDPAPDPSPTPEPVDAPAGEPAAPATGASWAPAGAASPDAVDPAAASGLRRQVFGFLPYWETSGAATKLNFDVLSTVAYFSVGANKAGDLKKRGNDGSLTTGWAGWTSKSMTNVIEAAHARGTRVVLTISVFAWTTSQASVQKALLGSASARANLARQAAAAVRDRGADGINLDFEPLASGYADEFVALLKKVRTELNEIKKGYQLTYDTTGSIGNYPLEASVGSGAADAIFIMGYDYRTASSSYVGSIDPLSGPRYDLTDTVRAYTARVPASRLILGIPWYGRAWSTVSDELNAKSQSGLKYGYSTAVNYESVVDLVAKHGRRWDSREQTPWLAYRRENCTQDYGCVTSWRQVYYDDATSLKARYAMVNDYGLRGSGIWALGYDGGHSELYRAISDSFLVDKSGPQAGVKSLATTTTDEGFVVSWAAKDVSSIASYDVQVSTDGGAWTGWLTGTRATSEVWLGDHGHGYAFRVRGKDVKGNVGPWNVTSTWDASPPLAVGGFGRVRIDGLSYRTGPDTSSAKLGTLDSGTILAITGGPVSSDGYTWWEVTQPIREWAPVSFVERGVWLAGKSSTETFVAAFRAPNSTTVDAGLQSLGFGPGAEGVGTAPTATAIRAFSPNGDGAEDDLRIRWTNAVALQSLAVHVFRTDGTGVGSRNVPALAPGGQAWDWNGALGGSRLPDGRYVLQLVGSDGSKTYHAPSGRPVTAAQVAAYAVTIDTVAPSITSATASSSLISPNGDGTRDTVAFSLAASGASGWRLRVVDGSGTAVRTVSGTGSRASVTWNGRDDGGSVVADGRYTAELLALDTAGNVARKAFTVTVDTAGPAVTSAASPGSFSPDGDGAADTTRLSWTANEKGTGKVRIYKDTTLIRSWSISSLTSWAAKWDGRRSDGSRVGDGRYTFRVRVKDAAGNSTTTDRTVIVDRTAGMLRWSRDFYPQDGDSLRPTATVSFRLGRTATTTLRVLDAKGTVVRTAWTGRELAAGTRSWTWDGRNASGGWVTPGRYTAELVATSWLGTTRLTRGVLVDAFSASVSDATLTAGQTLTVRFRSVEPLSSRPTVTFSQPGRADVKVTATRLSDGSYRARFTVQSGAAGAAKAVIRAKDSGGRINTTSVALAIVS